MMAEKEISVDCENQKKEITGLLKLQLKKGDTWYLVDSKWFKQWKRYVGFDSWETSYLADTSAYPGVIDNSVLFKDDTDNLKEHLVDELDYVLLPTNAWNKVLEWYGIQEGQKPISRKVIEQGMFVKHCKVEVYMMDLKLCQNDSMDQVTSRPFSRADTIEDIQRTMREVFSIDEKKEVRLWNKYMTNTYEHLGKPQNTVQDAGLYPGQIVVVEEKNEDGSWPRDAKNLRHKINNQQTSVTPSSSTYYDNTSPGVCGLSNLGNTCFMNSALQCMSNVSCLTEYFTSGKWQDELNRDNPLGMRGEIATTYAQLLCEMWSGTHSYAVPRSFKTAVGRFAPQFSGYQQQDSQELMAFLLDGLHEDLNRIKQKPYIEKQDDDNKPDRELAAESWSLYKKRNDSIIVDTFHGQLKSTLVCPVCEKISVTFDPFCYLSLPLPVKKERYVEVLFKPLNANVPQKRYKVTVPINGYISDVCLGLQKFTQVHYELMYCVEVNGRKIQRQFIHDDSITLIDQKNTFTIFEIPQLTPSDALDTIHLPVYLRTHGMSKTSYCVFAEPLLLQVSKTKTTYKTLYTELYAKLQNNLAHSHRDKHRESSSSSLSSLGESSDHTNGIIEGMQCNDSNLDSDGGDQVDNHSAASSAASSIASSTATLVNSEEFAQENNMAEHEDSSDNESTRGQPIFTLSLVNSFGTQTSEMLKNDDKPIKFFSKTKVPYLAADFSDGSVYIESDEAENHESMQFRPQKRQSIKLNECLELFTQKEKLGAQDLWYCPKCKAFQQATKKFDLWKLPRVLVIHLKRFSYTRIFREKIDTTVEYPVSGLDMKRFVQINDSHGPCKYDLIAVSNHYGGMGGGHYTAFGKNTKKGWYHFDDASASKTPKDSVVTREGYVLVYELCSPHMNNGSATQTHATMNGDSHLDEDDNMDMEIN